MGHVAVSNRPPENVLRPRGDQKGSRGDEGADIGPAPAVIVDPERAVAVAVGAAVGDDLFDASRLADGNDHFDPLVGSSQAPRDDTAAAQSRHAHAAGIDVWPS